jgi:hypothetical protein
MQTIGGEMFKELERIADEKGIRVQELLRAVIIPEWVQKQGQLVDSRWNSTGAQMSDRKNTAKIGFRNPSSPLPRVL